MNPRVSRSSALASKATGFPIARSRRCWPSLHAGRDSERHHAQDTASFEPSLDYVVVKIGPEPRRAGVCPAVVEMSAPGLQALNCGAPSAGVQAGPQPEADRDRLECAAQMDLHPAVGKFLDAFHAGEIHDGATVDAMNCSPGNSDNHCFRDLRSSAPFLLLRQ